MSDLLVMLVFLPMAAGPFGFWMGLRYPKARDTFVLVVTVLELFLIWAYRLSFRGLFDAAPEVF